MKTYEQTLTEMSNEQLLEDYGNFCVACYEDPDNIGNDSTKYSIEQEILKRMSAK